MKIIIVIPTYNERENIPLVLSALESALVKISNHHFEVLVVDDNSPDGTADVVKEIILENTNSKHLKGIKKIEIINGVKEGLGVAYARGFKYAIEKMHAEALIEMDADMQHDPIYIKDLVSKIDDGFDYVIGSRYITGGNIPKEWGIHRKILSYFGSFVARVVLGLNHVKDFTGGFKASRVKGFVENIKLDNLISKRYAYKIQYLYLMCKLGAKVAEVPINFKNREKEFSKSTIEDIFESLKVVFILRFSDYRKFIKS